MFSTRHCYSSANRETYFRTFDHCPRYPNCTHQTGTKRGKDRVGWTDFYPSLVKSDAEELTFQFGTNPPLVLVLRRMRLIDSRFTHVPNQMVFLIRINAQSVPAKETGRSYWTLIVMDPSVYLLFIFVSLTLGQFSQEPSISQPVLPQVWPNYLIGIERSAIYCLRNV